MMQNPFRSGPTSALIWEVWQVSRLELLVRFLSLLGLACILRLLVRDMDPVQQQAVRGLVTIMLLFGAAFSVAWLGELDRERSGFSFRLGFTRPVSTSRLVVVPMLFMIASSALYYLLSALAIRVIWQMQIPMIGPMLLVSVVVACFIAATWSPSSLPAKIGAFAAMFFVIAAVFFVFHRSNNTSLPIVLAIGNPEYLSFGISGLLAGLFVVATAIAISVYAVDHQRHGESLKLVNFKFAGWLPGRSQSNAISKEPFASRFTAQFWYEYRKFGALVLGISVALPLALLAALVSAEFLNPAWEDSPTIWVVVIVICPFFYQIVAATEAVGLRKRNGSIRLSAFDASRSLRNDALIAIKFLMIAVCSLIGWGVMIGVAMVHGLATGSLGSHLSQDLLQQIGSVSPWWMLSLAAVSLMFYLANCSLLIGLSLWMPMFPRVFAVCATVVFLHIMAAIIDASRGWQFREFWMAEAYLLSAAIVLGSIWCVWKAIHRGTLTATYFLPAAALWCIYVTSMVIIFQKVTTTTVFTSELIALGLASLLIPLASIAIAPLALASHRHG